MQLSEKPLSKALKDQIRQEDIASLLERLSGDISETEKRYVWGELYRRYYKSLYSKAKYELFESPLRSVEPGDLVNDAFVDFFEKTDKKDLKNRIKDPKAAPGYVSDVLENKMRDRLRKLRGRGRYATDESDDKVDLDEVNPGDVARAWDRIKGERPLDLDEEQLQKVHEKLHEEIEKLPPLQRNVIKKFYWERKKTKEIAREEGCSPSKVDTLRHRGIRKLRKLMTDLVNDLRKDDWKKPEDSTSLIRQGKKGVPPKERDED